MRINPLSAFKKFNVIILAAGKGTRIRLLNKELPKPLTVIKGITAIDFLIMKFEDVAQNFIICTGYGGQQIEEHLLNTFPGKKFIFVTQDVNKLANGPGKSAILGVQAADEILPTIFMFCDILIEDIFDLSYDGLGLYKKVRTNQPYVVDYYKTKAVVYRKSIIGLVYNLDSDQNNGWTGLFVCHDTKHFKTICEQYLKHKQINLIDYSMDLVKKYIDTKKVKPIYLSKLYEFGTPTSFRGCQI